MTDSTLRLTTLPSSSAQPSSPDPTGTCHAPSLLTPTAHLSGHPVTLCVQLPLTSVTAAASTATQPEQGPPPVPRLSLASYHLHSNWPLPPRPSLPSSSATVHSILFLQGSLCHSNSSVWKPLPGSWHLTPSLHPQISHSQRSSQPREVVQPFLHPLLHSQIPDIPFHLLYRNYPPSHGSPCLRRRQRSTPALGRVPRVGHIAGAQ